MFLIFFLFFVEGEKKLLSRKTVATEWLKVARLILTRRNLLAAFVALTNLKFSSRTEARSFKAR